LIMMRPVALLGVACVALALPLPSNHDAERELFVNQINSMDGITWKAAFHPRWTGLPLGASKSLCGVKNESKADLDLRVQRGEVKVMHATGMALPDTFDSATNWPACAKVINEIRDQSNCGCCWAFGGAEAASDRMCIATNASIALPLSAEDMCFCAQSDGCDGGFLGTAWNYLKSNGLVTGGDQGAGAFDNDGLCSKFSLPHCHHHGPTGSDPYPAENTAGCPAVTTSPRCPTKCDADAKAPHNDFASDKYSFTGSVTTFANANAIAESIFTSGPVEAAFSVYSDFENYASGIYSHKSGSQVGGHAIRIVGWGTESGVSYWKVANSWNPYWGENGYFRIKRGNDECGIESQATASATGAKWGKKSEIALLE